MKKSKRMRACVSDEGREREEEKLRFFFLWWEGKSKELIEKRKSKKPSESFGAVGVVVLKRKRG